MISRSYNVHNTVLLCIMMMIAACQSSSDKDKQTGKETGSCDTTLLTQYQRLKDSPTAPPVLCASIKSFYRHTPERCRTSIATAVIKDLFDLVYNNRHTDSLILPFLRELTTATTLTQTQQCKASFSIAGYYLYVAQDPDSAFQYIQRARNQYPNMNDTTGKSYHTLMGLYMLQKSDLKAAADHYLKAISLCEKLKDSVGIASNYANYSAVFSNMGEHNKSIAMRTVSTEYFKQQKQYGNMLIAYVGIGVEYSYLRKYDSATWYYRKAIQLTEQGVRNPNVEYDLYISLAGINLGQNQYDTARYYYNKIKGIIDLSQDKERHKNYTMASTPAFAEIRNVDREISEIQSYIPGFYAENNLKAARDAYYTLFHTYYLQNVNDKALKNYRIYDSLKSILAREENKEYVAEMETKYETQKKQLKIEVQQKEIKQTNILNGFLLALLAVAGLATAFVFTRIQLKRRRKDAELQQQFTRQLLNTTEEERGRIARDLHDGISQELLILKRQMGANQAHTNDKIDAIINEIRMISRDLHPVMLDKIGLKLSIEHICTQMMEHNLLFIAAEINYNNSLDRSAELQLFRMIQEALNNIVKYAAAEAARVTITETATSVCTEIIDNGKGFDVTAALNSKMSFGLLSLKERSKSMKGKTEITSSDAGTVVKIEIPKSHV